MGSRSLAPQFWAAQQRGLEAPTTPMSMYVTRCLCGRTFKSRTDSMELAEIDIAKAMRRG